MIVVHEGVRELAFLDTFLDVRVFPLQHDVSGLTLFVFILFYFQSYFCSVCRYIPVSYTHLTLPTTASV